MTRDEILKMEAGREMDALVAEKVMGLCPHYLLFDVRKDDSGYDDYITWTCKYCQEEFRGLAFKKGYNHPRLLHYSTNIADAWQVVESIHLLDDRYLIETTNGWGIYMIKLTGGEAEMVYDAETAPLAICRAALLAVMEVDNNV